MAKLSLNLSDDLQRRIDKYCGLNDMTRTTFIHVALEHYLQHLKLQSNLENIFTTFITEKMKQKKGEQVSESVKEKADF